jgi:hypothetical protein
MNEPVGLSIPNETGFSQDEPELEADGSGFTGLGKDGFGSLASILAYPPDVRFAPDSDT